MSPVRSNEKASSCVTLLNPLPHTLSHYAVSLQQCLKAAGAGEVNVRDVQLESGGSWRDLAQSARAWRSIVAESRCGTVSDVVIMWPLLGYLDVLHREAAGRAPLSVIVHDPTPLASQRFGAAHWGRVAKSIYRFSSAATLVVHSEEAAGVLARLGFKEVRHVPHPVAIPPSIRRSSGPSVGSDKAAKPQVVVLGQYKGARDLQLMEGIAAGSQAGGWDCRIVGAGWPIVRRWQHVRAFVTEEQLTASMLMADVVLVPYRRFFQSGIAVRALEMGRPLVIARCEFSESLLGADYPGLVSSSAPAPGWSEAIASMLITTDDGAFERYERYRDKVTGRCARLLASSVHDSSVP